MTSGLSLQERQKQLQELYLLLGRQVNSYYKARHMGSNTSVSSELAGELFRSMEYTLEFAEGEAQDLTQALEKGQAVLSQLHKEALELFRLVEASSPAWQGECRWDTIRSLSRYLQGYDLHHLAHREPEVIYYPMPVAVPESMRGIQRAQFYLRMLWIENQIMAAFSDDALEPFWSVFCQNDRGVSENQCWQLLIQAAGRRMLGKDLSILLTTSEDQALLSRIDPDFSALAEDLMSVLHISDPKCLPYISRVLEQLQPRMRETQKNGWICNIFLSENRV